MAHVDKTESAVGVVRGVLGFDIVPSEYDTVIPCGISATGTIVKGAGQTGVIGVLVPSKTITKAGKATDIFVLADVVNCEGLQAGRKYYSTPDGALSTDAAAGANAPIGFTVEADRLLIRL
jgi:hypothetical protein